MRKCRSFNYHCVLWLGLFFLTMAPQLTRGAESPVRSAEVQGLLRFVPESTVSVFCFDATVRLRRWDDLRDTDPFEVATCFTTMLVQSDTQLGLQQLKVRCAVSAVRSIRRPKQDPTRPVVDGPFQSERCELLVIPKGLARDWQDSVAVSCNLNYLEIEGRKVVEVPIADEKLLVAQLADNILCVANHAGFLTEVLQLAREEEDQRPASIEKSPAFNVALSCISPRAKFWGIRLFGSGDDAKDPTSVCNVQSLNDFHDPLAIFVTAELADVESQHLQFHYASEDALAATKSFPDSLERGVEVTHSRGPLTIRSESGKPDYVVTTTTTDLTKWKIRGMNEPAVLFLAFCTVFGQGMML